MKAGSQVASYFLSYLEVRRVILSAAFVILRFLSSFASCHPERSEGSGWPHAEVLRCAQDDKPDLSHIRLSETRDNFY